MKTMIQPRKKMHLFFLRDFDRNFIFLLGLKAVKLVFKKFENYEYIICDKVFFSFSNSFLFCLSKSLLENKRENSMMLTLDVSSKQDEHIWNETGNLIL